MESYDYIIAGAGCAGLSLVYYLLESDLKNSKILLIDPMGNKIPDKTWCYWAEKPLEIHPPQSVHFWNDLSFTTNKTKVTKNLGRLNYYHLNSHDFFKSIFKKLANHPNVSFVQDEVLELTENSDCIQVKTKSNGTFQAALAFDSRLRQEDLASDSSLKQIFSGWRIKTQSNVFDPKSLILMEFSKINSNQFEFIYILPFSETEALVEFTCYSQKEISEQKLNSTLKAYLGDLTGGSDYEISFRESGVIPMSNRFGSTKNSRRVIKIGTAAGWTKASTGYTFHTIQKNCQKIVEKLEAQKIDSFQFARSPRYIFYDNILLNIANKWPEQLQGLFLNLFTTSSADTVLRFLSEETSFKEELKLLSKLRFPIFIKSLLKYESH